MRKLIRSRRLQKTLPHAHAQQHKARTWRVLTNTMPWHTLLLPPSPPVRSYRCTDSKGTHTNTAATPHDEDKAPSRGAKSQHLPKIVLLAGGWWKHVRTHCPPYTHAPAGTPLRPRTLGACAPACFGASVSVSVSDATVHEAVVMWGSPIHFVQVPANSLPHSQASPRGRAPPTGRPGRTCPLAYWPAGLTLCVVKWRWQWVAGRWAQGTS